MSQVSADTCSVTAAEQQPTWSTLPATKLSFANNAKWKALKKTLLFKTFTLLLPCFLLTLETEDPVLLLRDKDSFWVEESEDSYPDMLLECRSLTMVMSQGESETEETTEEQTEEIEIS